MRKASRMARYMMMRAGRENKSGERGNDGGPRGNYPRDNYPRYEYPEGGMRMNYEAENRFRDRRGRERYDDGRFAPKSAYSPENRGQGGGRRDNPRGGYPAENRGGDTERRGGTRSHYPMDDDGEEDYPPMNIIGFGDRVNEMRAQLPGRIYGAQMDEMQHRTSPKMAGHAEGYAMEFTPEIADEWVKGMHNEDGTSGEHWTMEQVKKMMATKGVQYDHAQVYAIMNALYSDYCKVLKKYGVTTPDAYLDLAVAWLNDKDAVKDKAAAYYEFVVRH